MIESFIFYGLIGNLAGITLVFIINVLLIASLKKEEFEYLLLFKAQRMKTYYDNATKFQRVLSILLSVLPTYHMWLSSIYIFNFFKYKGIERFIMATIVQDRFRIDQVVFYDVIESDK